MENLLEKNLNFLSRYNSALAEKIRNCNTFDSNYEINPAKSDDSILYKDGNAVDDPIDPVWRSIEMFSSLESKSIKGITVIYGLGMGYILKEFAKKYKGKIIIHEPNLEILRIAFEFVDFSEELAKKTIMVTNTLEDVFNAYNKLFYKDYKYNFVTSDYYSKYENDSLNAFIKNVNDYYVKYQQTYNNLQEKNKTWSTLLFNNIPNIVNSPDLHLLRDKFQGKTAVIISAGPSLDKNIENLKPYRDKLVVFCVGVAFKTAVKHGIIPDFVAIIDNDKNILDIPEVSDTNLIVSTYSISNIYELNAKRFYNYHTKTTPACTWLARVLQDIDINDYDAAGTVAINCFYSAKLMGCKKIVLIGQDLAYTHNKCYSDNSAYAGFKLNESNDVEFAGDVKEQKEDITIHSKFLSKNLIQIKGLNNTNLFTRPDYYMFILFFENLAEKYSSELELINATEGGAYLKGFKHITLNEALEKCDIEEKIDVEKTLKNYEQDAHETGIRKKRVLSELKTMIKNSENIKDPINLAFKEGIMPFFPSDFEVKYNCEKKKQMLEIWLRKVRGFDTFSEEEESLFLKIVEIGQEYDSSLESKIEELFDKKPDLFAKNLKILKDSYFKIRPSIDNIAYYKNLHFTDILHINNLINDFDELDKDKELIKLSYALNKFINCIYYYRNLYNLLLDDIIKKLENLEKSKHKIVQ